MRNDQEILAEAVRIEIEEKTGRTFIVFEAKSEKFKKEIKTRWTDDIEFRLIDKMLVKGEE
jgi:hypothetical protein